MFFACPSKQFLTREINLKGDKVQGPTIRNPGLMQRCSLAPSLLLPNRLQSSLSYAEEEKEEVQRVRCLWLCLVQ